jgi:tetratricopeptide (TPR) repeat protein
MSTINEALKRAARSAAGGQTGDPGGPAADLFPEALAGQVEAQEGAQPAPGPPEPVGRALRLPNIPRWALAVGALALLALAYAHFSPVPQARSAAAEPAVYRQKIIDDRERLLADEELPEEKLAEEPAPGSDPDEAAAQTAKAVVKGAAAAAEEGDEEGEEAGEGDEDIEDDEGPGADDAAGGNRQAAARGASPSPLPARRRLPAPAPQAPIPVNRAAPSFTRDGVAPYGPLPATQFAYTPPQAPAQPPVARPAAASAQGSQQQSLTDEIFRQAVEREKQGKLDQAGALYALVLDKEAGRESASLRLGNLLYRQQRYSEATEVFRKAIGVRDSAVLHNNLGTVYLAQGKMDLAREEFTTAANSDAGYVDPRYNLACYYALIGQPQEGLAELEKAKAIDPQVMEWAAKDGDLAGLRAIPAYKRLTE